MKLNFFNRSQEQGIIYPRIIHTPGYPQGWVLHRFKKNQKVKVTDKVAWVVVQGRQCIGIIREDVADTFTEVAWDQVHTEKLGTRSFWVFAGKRFDRLKDAVKYVQDLYS
jgi:hypothetical protein